MFNNILNRVVPIALFEPIPTYVIIPISDARCELTPILTPIPDKPDTFHIVSQIMKINHYFESFRYKQYITFTTYGYENRAIYFMIKMSEEYSNDFFFFFRSTQGGGIQFTD